MVNIERKSLCLNLGLLLSIIMTDIKDNIYNFITKPLSVDPFAEFETKDVDHMGDFLGYIAQVESSSGSNLIQDTNRGEATGPGTGYIQWEVHGTDKADFTDSSGAAWNIINRAFLNSEASNPNNEWLSVLWNQVSSVPVEGQGRVGNVRRSDILNLTKEQQYFIQAQSIKGDKNQLALFEKFVNAKDETAKLEIVSEWWLDYHWKGAKKGSSEYNDKKDWFINQFGTTNKVFNAIKGIF